MSFSVSLELQSARLQLRPLRLSDEEMIWPDISDPQVSHMMAWEAHSTREQTMTFLAHEVERHSSGRGCTWAILKNGTFCGIVSLIAILRNHRAMRYDKAELGYWLGRSSRGEGLMTEACNRVMDFAFDELRLHKIAVSHFGPNERSKALIFRLGFRHIGTQRREFEKQGIWYDHVLYEMLAEERPASFGQRSPHPPTRTFP